LPSQECRVKTFAENKRKEDTRMDIIIHPQDAVGSPNPSASPPPKHQPASHAGICCNFLEKNQNIGNIIET